MVFVAVEVVGWKSHGMICSICVQLSLFELANTGVCGRFSLCLLDIWLSIESILFSHLFSWEAHFWNASVYDLGQ